jgi:hypothetical protein
VTLTPPRHVIQPSRVRSVGAMVLVGLLSAACTPSDCSCTADPVVWVCSNLHCPSVYDVGSCPDAINGACGSQNDAAFIESFSRCFSSVQPTCIDYSQLVVAKCMPDGSVSPACNTALQAQIAAASGS